MCVSVCAYRGRKRLIEFFFSDIWGILNSSWTGLHIQQQVWNTSKIFLKVEVWERDRNKLEGIRMKWRREASLAT